MVPDETLFEGENMRDWDTPPARPFEFYLLWALSGVVAGDYFILLDFAFPLLEDSRSHCSAKILMH